MTEFIGGFTLVVLWAVIGWAIYFLPRRRVRKSPIELKPADALEYEKADRDAIVKALGVAAVLVTVVGGLFTARSAYQTYRDYGATYERQISQTFQQQYKNALEAMSSSDIRKRMGGLFSIGLLIAPDSANKTYMTEAVMTTVAEYLRTPICEKGPDGSVQTSPGQGCAAGGGITAMPVTVDIQVAIQILAKAHLALLSNDIDLTSAPLTGGSFADGINRLDWSGTSFEHASLRGANFYQTLLRWARFNLADLSGTNLLEADFFQARLVGTNLCPARHFSDVNLSKYDSIPVWGIKAKFHELNHDISDREPEYTTSAASAFLPEADFEEAYLPFWFFDHAVLHKALFKGATIDRTSFRKAELDGSSFAHGPTRAAILRRIDMSCIYGKEASFAEASLDHVIFAGADLRATNFDKASLSAVSFRNADLTDASFKGANFAGMEGAIDGARLCHTTLPTGERSDRDCSRSPELLEACAGMRLFGDSDSVYEQETERDRIQRLLRGFDEAKKEHPEICAKTSAMGSVLRNN